MLTKTPKALALRFVIACGTFVSTLSAGAKLVSIDTYIKKPGIEDTSSFCYVRRDHEVILGQRSQVKEKIASVTKLFTSFYVLKTLGPNFRFATQIRYDEKNKVAYILGSKDPYIGERVLHYFISELNRLGIKELKALYFDEKFAVYRGVEVPGKSMWADAFMPSEVRYFGRSSKNTESDLKSFFNNFRFGYEATRQAAENLGVSMVKAPTFRVGKIGLLSREEMLKLTGLQTFTYRSSPLLRYVKDLNSHSNNYVADQLIAATGGIENLRQFYQRDYGYTDDDFEFRTGSGLWVNDPYVEGSERVRSANQKDNLATCQVVMDMLSQMDRFLKKQKLKLQDVVMVASKDRGSLNLYRVYKSEELSSAVMAKTGTLANATALAGELTTETGDYFFGIFFETFNRSGASQANRYRDQIVRDLMSEVGGKSPIDYTANAFLPFDKESTFETQKSDSRLP